MSGFEIVGVVLGALPLIISAIEDYEKIIDPVVTFRKYSKALQTFTTELNVQRDIFQNECIWILSRFVNGHDLEDMLKDPAHHLRRKLRGDHHLDSDISKSIGQVSYRQLRDILVLISDTLNEIYQDTRDLPEGLSKSTSEAESLDLKAWRRHVKQKLKLSLSKPALNKKIDDLRHRNQAFLAISLQIARFNVSWNSSQSQQDLHSADKNLEKVRMLQTASKNLYQHLEKLWSCAVHPEHSINLRLSLETSEFYRDASSQMSFDMALTYYDYIHPSSETQEPVLLAIEPTTESVFLNVNKGRSAVRFADTQPSEDFNPSQIRRQTSARRDGQPKKSGFRRFFSKIKGESGHENPQVKVPTPLPALNKQCQVAKTPIAKKGQTTPRRDQDSTARDQGPAKPALPDLSSVPDLCYRILELSKSTPADPTVCIGSLSGLGKDRYTVYSRQTERSSHNEIISLTNIVCGGSRSKGLSKSEKWRVAGALSLAVLLYDSTPWLHNALRSDDILFLYSNDPDSSGAAKAPHLHTVGRNTAPYPQTSKPVKDDWVKNQMLYNLGILLLEIEFGDQIKNLVESTKLPGSPQLDEPLTRQLQLLKRRSGEQLGTLYGRMVRMCLDCDFGLGLDEYTLQDPRVQKVFYSQVIAQFQDRMPEYSKIWSDD